MKHIIYVQMGEGDSSSQKKLTSTQVTYIDVIQKGILDLGIDRLLRKMKKIGAYPTELGVDLWLLALAVYAADTRISRQTEAEDSWTREINIILPVSDLKRWNRVRTSINKILGFLTSDKWTIEFRERPSAHKTLLEQKTDDIFQEESSVVSLFSGGLDSLIGAIDLLSEKNQAQYVFVSHYADKYTSVPQGRLLNGLRAVFTKKKIDHIGAWVNFPKTLVNGVDSEKSTRSRSFLFFSLGVFVGLGLGRSFLLRVPENGLIALNVPLDNLRLGSNSTRTAHPYYLTLWNQLLQELGIDGKIENPFWNKTKGEMIKECANQQLLKQLAPESVSCSSPNKNHMKKVDADHCGYCLPCVIRRAAFLHAWGVGGDLTKYLIEDLNARVLDSCMAEGVQIRSFQYAIRLLQKRESLAKFWILKAGPLHELPDFDIQELEDVYLRGMSEVANLLKDVRTKAY